MSETQPNPDAERPDAATGGQAEAPAGATAVETLTAELTEMKDRWLRAEAEMQNLRARTRREVDEARQYAVQRFARDVVEMAENLRRGLDSLPAPEADEPELMTKLRGGFEGVERQFLAALSRHGIERVDPAGQPFDPNLHQAMAEAPSDTHAPGTVMQAWTPAWTLNGRLLKPAMVVVAAGQAKPDAA
jgi:molecular chaperone GrpE